MRSRRTHCASAQNCAYILHCSRTSQTLRPGLLQRRQRKTQTDNAHLSQRISKITCTTKIYNKLKQHSSTVMQLLQYVRNYAFKNTRCARAAPLQRSGHFTRRNLRFGGPTQKEEKTGHPPMHNSKFNFKITSCPQARETASSFMC